MKASFLTLPLLFLLFQSLFSSESVNFRDKRVSSSSEEDQLGPANEDIRTLGEEKMLLHKNGTRKESSKHTDLQPQQVLMKPISKTKEMTEVENVLDDEILHLLETLNDLMEFKFHELHLADNSGVDQEKEEKVKFKEDDVSFKTFNDFIKSKFRPNQQNKQSKDGKQLNSQSTVESKSTGIKTERVKSDRVEGATEKELFKLKKKSFARQGENGDPRKEQISNQAISATSLPVLSNLNEGEKRRELMVVRKPKMSDRAMFLSPQRLVDKKPFPEITSNAFGIIYQSPSREGRQQLLDSDEHEKGGDESLADMKKRAILSDGNVFGSGKTRSFPEIASSVLAAKSQSVSKVSPPDDNDRLDVGSQPTKRDKIDEIPKVFSKEDKLLAEDDVQNRIKNIGQEFLELDEKRSFAIIDPILKSLRKSFVQINQKALLRDLRSRVQGIAHHQTILPSLGSNEWNQVDPEKRATPVTPRLLESMAILRSLRSANPTKLHHDDISVDGLFNAISRNKFVKPHLKQISQGH